MRRAARAAPSRAPGAGAAARVQEKCECGDVGPGRRILSQLVECVAQLAAPVPVFSAGAAAHVQESV
eukprot:362449-Chlamydomonas_euryale.AAC.3